MATAAVQVERIEHDEEQVGRAWYLFAVSGVVSAVVGVLVLAYPSPSVKLLGIFLGIDLLVAGVLMIIRSSAGRTDETGPLVFLGALALIAGLIVIRNPTDSLVLLTVAFAVYLVVAGAVALGRGIAIRKGRGTRLIRGAVMVAAGTVIISWPDLSVKTFTVLTGIALVLQGVVEIAEAFALRAMTPRPDHSST